MRIFKNTLEMLNEVERELFEMGIECPSYSVQDKLLDYNPNYDMKELIGYSYAITDLFNLELLQDIFNFFDNDLKEVGKSYVNAEFADRIGYPSNPGRSWSFRQGLWCKFLENDNKFSYTYSERIYPQLDSIIEELKNHRGSRQCIITIYDQHNDLPNLGGKRRIPCSMYYQFMVRKIGEQDVLNLIYTMRSCDFYNHFIVDVILGLMTLSHVALQVKVVPGMFIHFIGSLHAFRKDWGLRRIF